jgi:hypothetical protein
MLYHDTRGSLAYALPYCRLPGRVIPFCPFGYLILLVPCG